MAKRSVNRNHRGHRLGQIGSLAQCGNPIWGNQLPTESHHERHDMGISIGRITNLLCQRAEAICVLAHHLTSALHSIVQPLAYDESLVWVVEVLEEHPPSNHP